MSPVYVYVLTKLSVVDPIRAVQVAALLPESHSSLYDFNATPPVAVPVAISGMLMLIYDSEYESMVGAALGALGASSIVTVCYPLDPLSKDSGPSPITLVALILTSTVALNGKL